MQLHIIFEKQL